MTIKSTESGKFIVRFDRANMPRVRKQFATFEEAEAFKRDYLARHASSSRPQVQIDARKLHDLIALWFKYHGINLADGERRQRCLLALSLALGNPIASELKPEAFVEYRFQKLQEGLTQKSLNNQHGYLSAMFNKLYKLKVIAYKSPLAEVDFIKIQERQLSYLSESQIKQLLNEIQSGTINPSTLFVTKLCLMTGARWGEAEQLRAKQIRDGRVTFEFTKSKRTRTIPLDKFFFNQLQHLAESKKNPNDRLFTNCIGAFRRAVKRAGIELPRGQNSHILRHTFASFFVMKGGSVLTLKNILGHADIGMTMRYAHLAPDHLQDAVKLNPLSNL